jgi:GntR family transcriptional regulator
VADAANAREPKHYQLKRRLADIAASLPAGSALPGERQLALDHATSRTTVRQALAALVVDGRLDRVHGRGTFVARPKVAQPIALTSYTDDMRAQGIEPATRLLALRYVKADDDLAARLRLPLGARLAYLERLRTADGEPMAVERAYLPAARFPDLRRQLERRGSLYATLEHSYGVRLGRAEETIETALATPQEAALLGVDTGLPMLLLSQLSLDTDERPVEWVRSVYRGDRYTFVAQVSRRRRGR